MLAWIRGCRGARKAASVAVFSIFLSASGAAAHGVQKDAMVDAIAALGINLNELGECQKAELNTCQDKSSGGHTGTIFTTQDGLCAKKVRTIANLKEYSFYKTMAELCDKPQPEGLCGFLPKFGGLCRLDGHLHIKMQYLKKAYIKADETPMSVRALDLKIGQHTYSATAMERSQVGPAKIFFNLVARGMQDSAFTSSQAIGLRYAGISDNEEQKLAPRSIFDVAVSYFSPQVVLEKFLEGNAHPAAKACLLQKAEALRDAVHEASFQKFHLIGASTLLIYDPTPAPQAPACELFVIDFANSLILEEGDPDFASKKRHQRYVASFRMGIDSLVRLLQAKAKS